MKSKKKPTKVKNNHSSAAYLAIALLLGTALIFCLIAANYRHKASDNNTHQEAVHKHHHHKDK
jgi:cytochrome c biogenesis protein ResB